MQYKKYLERKPKNNDIPVSRSRLATLKVLNEFKLLDTYLLSKLVQQEVGKINYGWFKNSLTAMHWEAGYITWPSLQFITTNADYKRRVYQLTDRGKKVLLNNGISIRDWGTHSNAFTHDWITSHCVGSVKLFTKLPFITPNEVAARSKEEKPFLFRFGDRNIHPDHPVFGLHLPEGPRFFIWETDCATETVHDFVAKVVAYHELDKPDHSGDNYFWHRLKIPNNYLCIVVTDKGHLESIMREVKKALGKSQIALFKHIPHFGQLDFTPEPIADILHNWERVGYEPFSMEE